MKPLRMEKPPKVPWLAAAAVTVIVILGMAYLRFTLYPHRIVPLTYALPMLLALWHRDRALLWGMAACFFILAGVKGIWLIPDQYFDDHVQQFIFTAMQWLNIVVPAGVVHLVLNYRERLVKSNEALAATNVALETNNEELAASNEELAAREEEISRQNEELQSQTEELEQQTEELRIQTEELQILNEEIAGREDTLQMLLQLSGPATSELQLLEQLCAAGPKLLGEDVAAVAVLERRDGELIVRAHSEFGAVEDGERLPLATTLAALAMERSEVAQLEDTRLRPDLRFPKSPSGVVPASIMSAPLFLGGQPVGALEVYASTSRGWTPQQAQLVDWLAGQCSRAWEHIRLRAERQRAKEMLAETEKFRKVAEAVQAERQRFNNVLDMLPVYVILLSPDYRVPFANRFFEERFGKSEGRRCYEYLFQRTEPCENCETFKVLKTGAPHRWEWTGPDNRNYDIYDFPFTDADGSPLIMEVGLDVTERKRAEAAVTAERQRFLDVLETLPVIVTLLRPDHRVEWANRAYREALGDNTGQLCYASQFGRDRPCEECQAFIPLETGQPQNWQWTLPSGRTFDIYNFPFADADGSPMILEMDIDITEQRQAEAALTEANERLEQRVAERTAALRRSAQFPEENPNPVLRVAADGTLLFANAPAQAWLAAWGATVEQPLPDAVRAVVADVYQQGQPLQTEIADPTGHTFWVSAVCPSGEEYVNLYGRDVTARKAAEVALQRSADELARSNKDLEQFAYVASHDLQEPLRMVVGYLQLLSERYQGQLDEKADKYIDYAVDGAKRMSGLIRDLLSYSRVNTRGDQLGQIRAEEALDLALRNLRASTEESGAAITCDPLPVVWADKSQLAQVFQNLIGNAIKFRSPDRPCQVHVVVEQQDGQWVFSVGDNGIGFDEQYQDKMFLIFQRLHSRGKYPGTGIGLALCKRIVERHGGTIWATGKPGEGATFCFTIPTRGDL